MSYYTEYHATYYEKNKERILAYNAEYKKKNKEKLSKYSKMRYRKKCEAKWKLKEMMAHAEQLGLYNDDYPKK